MTSPVRIAHFSDTHLGREQFADAVNTSGWNQRGIDLVRAWHNVVTDVLSHPEVPLALHAGDVGDTPNPPTRYMLAIKKELNRVAAPLEPGSPYIRQHVVIAGNHDMPRSPNDPCYLALFRGTPGLHIVTDGYQVVTFEDEIADGYAHPDLADVAVHAIPHDDLKSLDWEVVQPIEGKRNILLTHGVAEGSKLFFHAKGREYPIPGDVLARDWDYVALGHWHKRGPVFLTEDTKSSKSRIWYAGSPEQCNYSDAREAEGGKGYLLVNLPGERAMPEVEKVTLPIRPMVTLPAIDAEGLSPDDISTVLAERVKAADRKESISGSVLRQRVVNANQDLWALVDKRPARKAASSALAYDARPMYAAAAEVEDGRDDAEGTLPSLEQPTTDFEKLLKDRAEDVLAERLREPALHRSMGLLGKYLNMVPQDDEDQQETDHPQQKAS